MKRLLLICLTIGFLQPVTAQTRYTSIYDLLKKLFTDSTGFANVGDWAIGQPGRYPVQWKADQIEMSEDSSINFYRTGHANVEINGSTLVQKTQSVHWSVLLKGPRMGYTSFSIVCTPSPLLRPDPGLASLFGAHPWSATLLHSCTTLPFSGFKIFWFRLPKKDPYFLKLSWITANGQTAYRFDAWDSASGYAVKADCPK